MESVQARQRGALDFEGYYNQLCALQGTCPLTSVKGHLAEGVLDLNGDRIRAPDWPAILNAVRINKNLRFIGVRSYYQHCSGGEDSKDGKFRTRVKRRPPPVRSKDLTYRLCLAVKETLSASQELTHIELQGIPLRIKDVQLIAKGIAKNRSLQHLSMESCRIGDRGVETLCQGIKNSPVITSLNFSACGLTSRGAETLAKLVKHQSTQRHSEAWKDSLRYRRPDLDRMAGIRRITLNHNPLVNDDGAAAFAEALKDDLWLKALDIQQCGISNYGAKALLDGLQQNSSIVLLDIRKNHLVDCDLLKAVMEQVLINAGGEENEYKWLRANSNSREHGTHGSKPRRRTKTLNSSFGRKTTIRVTSGPSSAPPRSRSKSSGDGTSVHVTRVRQEPDIVIPAVTKPGPGFVPWRTAARASQRRVLPDEHQIQVDTSPSSTLSKSAASIHVHAESTLSSGDLDTSSKDTGTPGTLMSSMRDARDERGVAEKKMRRQMQVEIEELRRRLYIESRARAAADAHVVELEVSNSRLRHQVQLLEARSPTSPLRAGRSGPPATVDQLEDESILDSIEESFAKFHRFLDLLREAGLGQLCTLVGTSPGEIRNPHVRSILQKHQPTAYYHPSGTPSAPHSAPQQPHETLGPYETHHYAETSPGLYSSSGVGTSGAHVGQMEGPSTNSVGSDHESRQVYVHAPLVSGQEQNDHNRPDLKHIQDEVLLVANDQPTLEPRPVVVHLPLSEPPALQRITHPPSDNTTEAYQGGGRQQVNRKSAPDFKKQHQAEFDKELTKPPIEFTNKGTGSSGDAGMQRLADSSEDIVERTGIKDPVFPEPITELDSERAGEKQLQSDQEHSSHSSLGSDGHSHRTSTPTRSKETPPSSENQGSDNPTAATYSVDEDHESLGSPVLEEFDGSDEDLFMDLPTPTKNAGKGKPGNNNDKGFRGDDEYSSDEDF